MMRAAIVTAMPKHDAPAVGRVLNDPLARVEADPDVGGVARSAVVDSERPLHRDRALDPTNRGWKRRNETVARRLDLSAALRREFLARQRLMLAQDAPPVPRQDYQRPGSTSHR